MILFAGFFRGARHQILQRVKYIFQLLFIFFNSIFIVMDGFGTEEWCMETTYSDGDLFSATICSNISQPRFADLDFRIKK